MTDPRAETGAEKLRLFFAVRVPHEHLVAIDEALGPHRERFEGARWAPVSNQHITMKFLGSTPAPLLPEIVATGERVAAGSEVAEIRLAAMGCFPSRKRARVLWVGVDDSASVLRRLVSGLDEALAPLGFEPEKRAFTPHLTLARFKVPVPVPVPVPDDLLDLAGGLAPFRVEDLALFRSRLHPKGARYEVLETFPLGGG